MGGKARGGEGRGGRKEVERGARRGKGGKEGSGERSEERVEKVKTVLSLFTCKFITFKISISYAITSSSGISMYQ